MNDNFPIDSEQVGDKFWHREHGHFGSVLTKMDFFLNAQVMYKAMDHAFAQYKIPFRQNLEYVNNYLYINIESLESSGKEYNELLKDIFIDTNEKWNNEWLPEIKEHLNFWECYDFESASIESLLEHFQNTEKRLERCWEIHFLLYCPMVFATNVFEEMYTDLFEEPIHNAHLLLTGFDNLTIQSTKDLWKLSYQVMDDDTLKAIFNENKTSDILKKISNYNNEQAFLENFQNYLEEYGKKADKLYLSSRFWIETPEIIIGNIKNYINQKNRNIEKEFSELVNKRSEYLKKLDLALKNYPTPIKKRFFTILKAAQECSVIRENHNHWIDNQVTYQVRMVLLGIGKKLEKMNIIESKHHIFHFSPEELHGILKDPKPQHSVIKQRIEDLGIFDSVTPPPFIGASPTFEIPDDSLFRAFFKIDGLPIAPSENKDELQGCAAGPGVVIGTAKVILSLDEIDKLGHGDIMVTQTTVPSWTPFFTIASAVVTDVGGVLCHSAIVAREHSLPAVVGATDATKVIKDGQKIEVNGDTGVIKIL